MAEKFEILNNFIKLNSEQPIKLKGVSGKSAIVGIIPNLQLVIGNIPIWRTVGVINNGGFDFLIGNDITQNL